MCYEPDEIPEEKIELVRNLEYELWLDEWHRKNSFAMDNHFLSEPVIEGNLEPEGEDKTNEI